MGEEQQQEQKERQVYLDKEGLLKKEILKEGVGEVPEKDRDVYVQYVVRAENGGRIVAGSEAHPVKITMGRGDTFKFIEQSLQTMKLGERCLVQIAQSYVETDKRLLRLCGANTLELEMEIVRLGGYRQQAWELESAERIEKSTNFKESGNAHTKLKNFESSKASYELALRVIEGDSNKKVNAVRTALLSNLSLAQLKLSNFAECFQVTSMLLEKDPKNIKIIFRRAQAQIGLGEFSKAKADLHNALVIDPNNSDVIQELASLAAKEKKQNEKEKKLYSNMFA